MDNKKIFLDEICSDIKELQEKWFGENNIQEILEVKYENKKTKEKLSIYDCINSKSIRPKKENIFNAFKIQENESIIKPENIKVLIIGQDPYPNIQEINREKIYKAHGLSFSVENNYTEQNGIDDSLLNIYKAIKASKEQIKIKQLSSKQINEIKGEIRNGKWTNFWKTNLTNWAKNNEVLLLNTSLTYDESNSLSNRRNAWKPFVNIIIKNLFDIHVEQKKKLVVFLWGVDAQQLFFNCIGNPLPLKTLYKCKVEKPNDYVEVYMTGHPSPRNKMSSQAFLDSVPKHFAACDEFLFGKEEKDKKNYIWLNFPDNNKSETKQ